MKTKLTLTVRKSVILTAKRFAKKQGKSISQIFEEFFQDIQSPGIKTESERAAERLLKALESSKPVDTLDDKQLLRNHVGRKYA